MTDKEELSINVKHHNIHQDNGSMYLSWYNETPFCHFKNLLRLNLEEITFHLITCNACCYTLHQELLTIQILNMTPIAI